MAAATSGRSLEQTPTWAVAVVCFVLVLISIIIEHIIELIAKWLKKKHKSALYEALEKIKSELMLLGFISLLLTVGQGPISNICISQKLGNTWHPCGKKPEDKLNKEEDLEYVDETPSRRLLSLFNETGGGSRRVLAAAGTDKCSATGKVPFISADGIHQLHIFIFVLAVFHVLYCIITMALGRAKMGSWKRWEKETRTVEYQFSHDPERFRFARDTSFGRRHMSYWTKTPFLMWIVCFFRQFIRSVPKVDYLTLRHGFIMAHLAPQSHQNFNFQKYINRSLEEDFKVIITKMGLRIQESGEVVKGLPVVQPGDHLFWLNRPRLILYLINFVLFQNAFQLAFFAWSWYEFSLKSCFHEHTEDVVIRVSMGILIQILCSYVTLPLYALVTQMGTTMKPTIFNERVAAALRNWHHTARKHIKQNKGSVTPMSSRPVTPSHHASPVHLLRNYRNEVDSFHASPRRSNFEGERWANESPSPSHHLHVDGSSSSYHHHIEMGDVDRERVDVNEQNSVHGKTTITDASITIMEPAQTQHEINMERSKDFSFDKRQPTQ
ncbi:unnamed protein product [Malus baccata var. baccata]